MIRPGPAHNKRSTVGGTSAWRPAWLCGGRPEATIPPIGPDQARPLLPGFDLWDCWPLADEDGRTATVLLQDEPCQLWFFLSAPSLPDPASRHGVARIRLLSRGSGGWADHGPVLPEGLSPGSREWAGCAVLDRSGHGVTLYFTAAGRRGEPCPSFEQRLFAIRGQLTAAGLGGWTEPAEIVAADGAIYHRAAERESAVPGMLKAFRDPFWFRDPATGEEHIVFTASAGWTANPHGGMIGLATRMDGQWVLENPLVEAVGVNNELERPQVQLRDGRYYLFWSTQAHTFAPAVPRGPTGLYGMVADRLRGPWRPLNGTGLVAANPASEPAQSYSWCVTGEGEVWSFVDYWGMDGRLLADQPELVRRQFGGTPAPILQLDYAGDRVVLG